jgi:EAL domain-containing protein (putative c-di-GMP-specific phosphodiesterase class I)
MTCERTSLRQDPEDTASPAALQTSDPAAEIVRLAAKLIRLQSHLQVEVATETQAASCQSGRRAAIRSGVELLQGVAVSLISDIRQAIERNAFHYLYQPIVCATSGRLEGYEALIRWRRGEETLAPSFFLPLAEEARLIATIQQRLLDDIAAAYARLAPPAFIGINWSPVQLSDNTAVSALIDRTRELQIDPQRVVIEITERSAMIGPDLALMSVLRLKECGFRIALDDFGNGYSSFDYLSRLPIDIVKIDGSLTVALERSPRAGVIFDGIVNVAHRLGHQVVAEGVETSQQLAAVRRLGCDFAQGGIIGSATREPA